MITAVTIEGNPSRTIRQGFGGTGAGKKTTVHLTGERLRETTTVTVGDGPNALPGAVTARDPTKLVFTVLIGHGAPLGPHSVKVTAPSGSARFADAIVITPITAAPAGSDALDVSQDSTGTDAHPLRSLTKAATLAAAGDTISLKNGIYDIASGELFPQEPGKWNVPDNITLKGESRDATLLKGPRANGTCNNANALVLAGSARIEMLEVAEFCTGITTMRGIVTLREVAIRNTGIGVIVRTDSTMDFVDISGSNVAVDVSEADPTLTIINSRVHNNRVGIDAEGSEGRLQVTATEIDHNCSLDPKEFNGGVLVRGPATLTDVSIHDNQCPGVNMFSEGDESLGPLVITRGTFGANEPAGVALEALGKTTIRGSSFGTHKTAIRLGRAASLDLGTPDSPGGNRFTLCDTCDTIFDARPAPAQGSNAITVKDSTWLRGAESVPIPTGCSDTDEPKGRTSPPRLWHIEHPGSCASATGNIILN